jgi:hypothetical protein
MSLLPSGFSFFRGMILGALGLVVMLVGSSLNDLFRFILKQPELLWTLLMSFGIILAVSGPVWYWIGRPAYVWFRNRGGEQ